MVICDCTRQRGCSPLVQEWRMDVWAEPVAFLPDADWTGGGPGVWCTNKCSIKGISCALETLYDGVKAGGADGRGRRGLRPREHSQARQ